MTIFLIHFLLPLDQKKETPLFGRLKSDVLECLKCNLSPLKSGLILRDLLIDAQCKTNEAANSWLIERYDRGEDTQIYFSLDWWISWNVVNSRSSSPSAVPSPLQMKKLSVWQRVWQTIRAVMLELLWPRLDKLQWWGGYCPSGVMGAPASSVDI